MGLAGANDLQRTAFAKISGFLMRAKALLKTATDYSTKFTGKKWAWHVLMTHEECLCEDLEASL